MAIRGRWYTAGSESIVGDEGEHLFANQETRDFALYSMEAVVQLGKYLKVDSTQLARTLADGGLIELYQTSVPKPQNENAGCHCIGCKLDRLPRLEASK